MWVMTEHGEFVELQGTAEGQPFKSGELTNMLDLAAKGIKELITKQKVLLALP